MSTDLPHGAALVAAPHEPKQNEMHRHLDDIEQPARPLGTKRQALQGRRARAAVQAIDRVANGISVTFDLRPTSIGLLVERTQSRALGARLVQTKQELRHHESQQETQEHPDHG